MIPYVYGPYFDALVPIGAVYPYLHRGYRRATHAASHHRTRPPTTNLAETHVGTVGEDPGPVRLGCTYAHTARARAGWP